MCIEALKFYIGSKFTAVFVNICHILLGCFEFTCTISASSPKSNSAYLAIDEALALVERTGNLPVPLHLRNSPTKLMKDLNYGKNYKYSHDFPNHFVEQQFLPDELTKTRIWQVQNNPAESKLGDWLRTLWKGRY